MFEILNGESASIVIIAHHNWKTICAGDIDVRCIEDECTLIDIAVPEYT